MEAMICVISGWNFSPSHLLGIFVISIIARCFSHRTLLLE